MKQPQPIAMNIDSISEHPRRAPALMPMKAAAALSMMAPSRISSHRVRQDGRHAGRHRLYHCQEREATGCPCSGKADRRGSHKNELNPEKKPTLIRCVG